ncbi:MAG: hypothetical protein NT085_01605 [candidate division SR1 bacterium]|nr:hypothetical protein [candidate division SR1 bacterium]
MTNLKTTFNNDNAAAIAAMQQRKKSNKNLVEEHGKQWRKSIMLIMGITMIFIAVHDLNRWDSWSTYFGAIAVIGLISGGIAYAYGYWKQPQIVQPEKTKLNELAKEFLIGEALPALLKKLQNDGYEVSYSPETSPNDLLNGEEYIKSDGSLIDGQTLNLNKQLFLTKNGIQFVLTRWSFNNTDFDLEARVVTGAIQI